MGDINAACYACASHSGVLEQDSKVYPAHAQVLNKRPFPEGPHAELLVIDDRIALDAVPRGRRVVSSEVDYSFVKGGQLVEDAGLKQHDGKKIRNAPHCIQLGMELRGRIPQVEVSRQRRYNLAEISIAQAASGQATVALLQCLNSSWCHCLAARRPCMSLLHASFRDKEGARKRDEIFRASSGTRAEWQLLACLAPAMVANLAAEHSDMIISTDASEQATAAAVAPLDPGSHQQLWRNRDRRGAYTWVRSREAISAIRAETGAAGGTLEEALAQEQQSPERLLIEVFDFLEVFAGKESPLSSAMSRAGLRCGPRIDIQRHGMWDMECPRVIEWLLFLVEHDRVWYVHLAPACRTHSVALQPRLRSVQRPLGFNPAD